MDWDIDALEPISAAVQIKIAKQWPAPEEDEEGNTIEVEIIEEDLEEKPIEDKVLSIAC